MRCARCGAEGPDHRPCRSCHNRHGRESRLRNGGSRKYHLKQRYGLSLEDFDGLLTRQGFLCPICLKRAAVHVDHDHRSGKVRGILCEMCNGGLGQFRDNPDTIRAAIQYLVMHSNGAR